MMVVMVMEMEMVVDASFLYPFASPALSSVNANA
jgi:hypothetical protein